MSYQVLARKWRPQTFESLVGQEHVVKALTHALDNERLHHAWLFTGTRGVGKTTISRLLAKALNCDKGISSRPCGTCPACTAISADHFPDYIEIDAASNRGVDDMAALLEQAMYVPQQGRFKVYMIDEVHMLTGHAFNAMLKTLEEPPAHVKFILATTDPQKIPVTVLSRCLQFNLKQMAPPAIVSHLTHLLTEEKISFEPAALRHLAKAAAGSMRDALSLLDQAIAHGGGTVTETLVTQMLGMVSDDFIFTILDALASGDIATLLAQADLIQTRSLSFDASLQTLSSLLQRIALAQFVSPQEESAEIHDRLQQYATRFDAEYLQLAYQIIIHARNELSLAPDAYTGFTMALLRLHAFRPEKPMALEELPAAAGSSSQSPPTMPEAMERQQPAPGNEKKKLTSETTVQTHTPHSAPPPYKADAIPAEGMTQTETIPPAAAKNTDSSPIHPPEPPPTSDQRVLSNQQWYDLLQQLSLHGMVRELAQHCIWAGENQDKITLRLSHAHRHLADMREDLLNRLESALSAHFGRPLKVRIDIGTLDQETPAQKDEAQRQERYNTALASLESDPFVQELIDHFDATLQEDSIKPNF